MKIRFCDLSRNWIIGFWLFVLTGPPGAAHATGISMDTFIGFDGFVRLEKWMPVTVVMENRGGSLNGTLEIQVTSGSEYRGDIYRTTYARELDLPYGARKRVAFTVFLRSAAHDVVVRFRTGENIRIADALDLKRRVIDRDAALVVDAAVSPDLLSSLPEGLFPVRVHEHRLPDVWYGYGGVRLVILNPAMLKRLDDRQFQALEGWLRDGGLLIVSAGMNYGSFRQDRMKRLMNVKINGLRRLFDRAALGFFSDRPFSGPDPLLVVDAEVEDSEILAAANGIPLVVEKRMARGRVVFFAFDIQSPLFNGWAGRQEFWEKILEPAPERRKVRYGVSDERIAGAMLSSLPLRFPSPWLAASLLLVHIAAVGILLKKAENRAARRIPYATALLLWISLFSMAGGWYFYAKNRMNRATFNSFTILNATGSRLNGFAEYVLGLYSIPETEFRVGFGGTAFPITHLLAEDSGVKIPNPYTLIESPGGQQVKTGSRKWSYHLFRSESQKNLPISVQAEARGGTLQLAVTNDSPHTVRQAHLYYRKRFFPVDPITARQGKTFTVDVNPAGAATRSGGRESETLSEGMGQGEPPSFFSNMIRLLGNDLVSEIHSQSPLHDDRLLLIGWIRTGLIEPEFSGIRIQGEGMALIVWEIPIDQFDN